MHIHYTRAELSLNGADIKDAIKLLAKERGWTITNFVGIESNGCSSEDGFWLVADVEMGQIEEDINNTSAFD